MSKQERIIYIPHDNWRSFSTFNLIRKSKILERYLNMKKALCKELSSCCSKGYSHKKARSIQRTKVCHWKFWHIKVPTRVRLRKGVKQRMAMKLSEYTNQRVVSRVHERKCQLQRSEANQKYNLECHALSEIIYIIKKSMAVSTSKGKIKLFVETCFLK